MSSSPHRGHVQHFVAALLTMFFCITPIARAQVGTSTPQPAPFVVEYYYKVKWGHQEEFLTLFRKNHLPLLQKQIASGRIVSVDMIAPRYHMPEPSRWDYRVTIVFKDAASAMQGDPPELVKQLYPDQATFKREEQQRFEILEAHSGPSHHQGRSRKAAAIRSLLTSSKCRRRTGARGVRYSFAFENQLEPEE